LPAIVTAVGDGATVLGDCGIVVRPRQIAETADAMRRMLAMGEEQRRALGRKARARIIDLYSIQAVAARYEATWTALAGKA
jgi:glycosyltransferase involved in cell wall biosynthesis